MEIQSALREGHLFFPVDLKFESQFFLLLAFIDPFPTRNVFHMELLNLFKKLSRGKEISRGKSCNRIVEPF